MNELLDRDLDDVIEICKNSGIIIDPTDIKDCQSLPLRLYRTSDNKSVVFEFVNRKHFKLVAFAEVNYLEK